MRSEIHYVLSITCEVNCCVIWVILVFILVVCLSTIPNNDQWTSDYKVNGFNIEHCSLNFQNTVMPDTLYYLPNFANDKNQQNHLED